MALAHYQGYVENVSTGKVLPSTVFRVYSYPGNVLQTVYADLAGTPKATVESDDNGAYDFYIADGNYDIEPVYNGVVQPRIVNIAIFNPDNYTPGPPINTILGVDVLDGDFGTFTGSTIPDDSTAKGALQALETATELLPTSAALAASGGSASVGFLQSGTGAVARTAEAELRDIVKVVQYNAAGTGSGDDGPEIQAALDYCGTFVRNLIAADPGKADGVLAAVHITKGTYRFTTALIIPEGVALFGDGANATFLQWAGAGVAITAGSTAREHSGILVKNLCVFGDGVTAGTEGIRFQNCVRSSGLVECQIYGFAINLRGRDSFQCRVDDNWIHDAIVNNVVWHGATAQTFLNNRIEDAGAENFILDGQSSGGVTDIEPIGVHIIGGTIQRAQTNGVKIIDGIAVTIKEVFFEGNNKAGSTNPHILALSGSMARTMTAFAVDDCQFFKGSAPGTTHRAIDVRNTTRFRSLGCFCRDAGFDKGIILATSVSMALIRGAWSGPTTPLDASSSNIVDYQDNSGNYLLGDGGRTATAFRDVKKSVSAGFLEYIWNSSATAGSVGQTIRGGNTNGTTFLEYHLDSSGANVFSLKDNGDMSLKGPLRPATPAAAFQSGALYFVTGVPSNANGSNGDFCFRTDGTAAGNSIIYHKEGGAWVAAVTT